MQIYDQNSNLIDNYTALQSIVDLDILCKYECVHLYNTDIQYHITDNKELKIDNISINGGSIPIFTKYNLIEYLNPIMALLSDSSYNAIHTQIKIDKKKY